MADSALFLILTKRPLLAFENDVMEWRVHPWNLLSTIYAKFLKILMSGSWLINSELEKWMLWKQLNNPKYPYLRLWISVANFNLREEYEYKQLNTQKSVIFTLLTLLRKHTETTRGYAFLHFKKKLLFSWCIIRQLSIIYIRKIWTLIIHLCEFRCSMLEAKDIAISHMWTLQ